MDPSETDREPPTDERVRSARALLQRDAVVEARELLTEADADGTLEADDLDRLGDALAWTGSIADALAVWDRAYAAHLAAGAPAAAARTALMIVREAAGLGQDSNAAGWYRRARRLLEAQEDCPAHGHLAGVEWFIASRSGDHDAAAALGERMLELGTRFADVDLQALGLLRSGASHVARGEVEEGLGRLDEATAAAVAGDLGREATFIVYCGTVTVCRNLADYRRAGEWALAARRWCERRTNIGFPGICRIYHAEILRLRGSWEEAEADVRSACGELSRMGLRAHAGAGFYELGEIRLRMGDLGSAEDAFCMAHENGRSPQPGLALVRLAQGRVDEAMSGVRSALDAERGDRLVRARLLGGLAEVALAAADTDAAQAAADELSTIADDFGSSALGAHAAVARAGVALALADAGGALSDARRALAVWQELDFPYEAACARVLAARALGSHGDRDGSRLELRAAHAAFTSLGAVRDMRQATDALRGEGADAPPVGTGVARALMFTDIVESTGLLSAIGDEAWVAARTWHDGALRDLFTAHGGEEISHAGDGFFVAFTTAAPAVTCAIQIQRTLDRHRRQHGFALPVRIGLHVAQATQTGDGYAGRGVHEAARIGGLAQGSEILASCSFLGQAGRVSSAPPREVALKGFDEPMAVATVDWRS